MLLVHTICQPLKSSYSSYPTDKPLTLTFDVYRDTDDLEFAVHRRQTTSVDGQINWQAPVDGLQGLVVPDVQTSVLVTVNVQDSNVNVVAVKLLKVHVLIHVFDVICQANATQTSTNYGMNLNVPQLTGYN